MSKKKPDLQKVAAAIKVIVDELGIDLGTAVAEVATPVGKGKAKASAKEIPPPENGENYTAEELANPGTFTRPVLVAILEGLGGDPKGKMPNELRTAILEGSTPANLGTCDFTEEKGVAVETHEVDGSEYVCGPKVCALMNKKKSAKARLKVLSQIIDGEIEL